MVRHEQRIDDLHTRAAGGCGGTQAVLHFKTSHLLLRELQSSVRCRGEGGKESQLQSRRSPAAHLSESARLRVVPAASRRRDPPSTDDRRVAHYRQRGGPAVDKLSVERISPLTIACHLIFPNMVMLPLRLGANPNARSLFSRKTRKLLSKMTRHQSQLRGIVSMNRGSERSRRLLVRLLSCPSS